MTGLSQGMVTVAVLLSVGPHVLLARTQKLLVDVSTGVMSIDGKLKYSSDPRMDAAACSSVRASSELTSPDAPLRRRNRAKKLCTSRVRASVELRTLSATLSREELPSSGRKKLVSDGVGARPLTSPKR